MTTLNGISGLNQFMTTDSWIEFTNKVNAFLNTLKIGEGFTNTIVVAFDNTELLVSEQVGIPQVLSLPPDQVFKINIIIMFFS